MDRMKKSKLFGLFNILDVAIILFVIAALAGMAAKTNLLSAVKSDVKDSAIEFKVKIYKIRDFSYNAVNIGDVIYDSETGVEIGTVADKKIEPNMTLIENLNGTFSQQPSPEYYDMTLTVEGKGKCNENGNFLNGFRLVAPGGTLGINTQRLQTTSTVISSAKMDKGSK
ncbi:MAG: DUF4330 domain-containing protein [Bacillota bacterium]|nr:DUF4330 domain-containing protein [Bacillota bacterium]